jgi:hypothetical protein
VGKFKSPRKASTFKTDYDRGPLMKSKILIGLILMALVDTIIPIPIAALTLLYVLSQKPPWFKNLVDSVYTQA